MSSFLVTLDSWMCCKAAQHATMNEVGFLNLLDCRIHSFLDCLYIVCFCLGMFIAYLFQGTCLNMGDCGARVNKEISHDHMSGFWHNSHPICYTTIGVHSTAVIITRILIDDFTQGKALWTCTKDTVKVCIGIDVKWILTVVGWDSATFCKIDARTIWRAM